MTVSKRFTAALVAISVLTVSAPAWAQEQPPPPSNPFGGTTLLLTTTGPTTTVIAGAVVLTVMLVRKPAGGSDDAVRATELYLKHNGVQLAQDLATGRGPAIDALAQGLRIPAEDARLFAELLRRDRAELMELADVDKVDAERALKFAQRLLAVMQSEPRLDAHIRQFAATF